MTVSIMLLSAVHPMLAGSRGADPCRAFMTAMTTGTASAERSTKICQSGNSALIRLIRASPSDRARTVKTIAPTASPTLSPSA